MSFDKTIEEIILNYIHQETGWGQPLRPHCEFEDLYILETITLENGFLSITFEYHFDEDGFSQYDRNHILQGKLILTSNYEIAEKYLEETHTGIACIGKPYQGNK